MDTNFIPDNQLTLDDYENRIAMRAAYSGLDPWDFAPLADEDVDTLLDEMAEYFHEDGSV